MSESVCSTRVKTWTDKIREMNICCSNGNKFSVSIEHYDCQIPFNYQDFQYSREKSYLELEVSR